MRKFLLPLIAAMLALAAPAMAQEAAEAEAAAAAVSPDVAYIFNTLLFLIGGFLVM